MAPYRLVIFDFDGTLADSFPWFRSVYNDMADMDMPFDGKRMMWGGFETVFQN